MSLLCYFEYVSQVKHDVWVQNIKICIVWKNRCKIPILVLKCVFSAKIRAIRVQFRPLLFCKDLRPGPALFFCGLIFRNFFEGIFLQEITYCSLFIFRYIYIFVVVLVARNHVRYWRLQCADLPAADTAVGLLWGAYTAPALCGPLWVPALWWAVRSLYYYL